jgi:hypothetical protein
MRKLFAAGVFLLTLFNTKAQDSTRIINHEIGFNTVSLIKQVISNAPSNTLATLPYDFFYNIYYKNTIGIRLGTGIKISSTETQVEGQKYPRITNKRDVDFRVGVSYNFASYKRATFNVFIDYVSADHKTETSNTSTVQTFPNPIERITTETTDYTRAEGGQVGVGLKFNVYKNLSLYAEMPLTYTQQRTGTSVVINESGDIDSSTNTTWTNNTQFFIPTTIYLVLRF